MFKKTPLSGGFLFAGIIGMIIFGMRLVYGTINMTWGFLMLLISMIVFISAVISITPRLHNIKDESFERELLTIKKEYENIDKQLSRPLNTFESHVREKRKVTVKKPTKKRTVKKTSKKTTKKARVKKTAKKSKKKQTKKTTKKKTKKSRTK